MRKKDKRKLQMWQDRLRENEAAMAVEQTNMQRRTELYEGTRYIETPPNTKTKKTEEYASNVRNIVAELIEAQVDSAVPMPRVTARRKAEEGLAKTAEDYLKNEMDRLPFERLNDLDERISPIQGGDIFFVEWDSDRHTHHTRGELCVSILHPRQVIFQDGVNEINDMDYLIINMGMTKKHILEKWGVDVEQETESDPESRGGTSLAEDVVTVHMGYFRNPKGGIGRFVWVNDVVLEELEDYQARKKRCCAKCGGDMTGEEVCPYCGSRKSEEQDRDVFTLYEDIVRSDGSVISQYEQVEQMPEKGMQPLMMDTWGNAYEAQPVTITRPREIPYYKPDIYPIVIRKNVSVWGKVLGDSDVDKIADQQNMIKKCDTRVQEKLDLGGSVLTQGEETELEYTDEQLKIVRFKTPAERSLFGVHNLQVDTSFDQMAANECYEQARRILGITDSFQGRPDRTATSGTAKQIAVAQSAGRLESKRIMKNATYADLYEVMFKFLLAYSDEPRSVRHKNVDGSTTYSEFNKYDYLAQDAAGEWYWIDDFLFGVDNSSVLTGNREAMWQEIRMNLQTGAFGNPQETDTLILFWSMMAKQQYPFAAEIKEQLESKRQENQPNLINQTSQNGKVVNGYE